VIRAKNENKITYYVKKIYYNMLVSKKLFATHKFTIKNIHEYSKPLSITNWVIKQPKGSQNIFGREQVSGAN
jgi:hypothetical protein